MNGRIGVKWSIAAVCLVVLIALCSCTSLVKDNVYAIDQYSIVVRTIKSGETLRAAFYLRNLIENATGTRLQIVDDPSVEHAIYINCDRKGESTERRGGYVISSEGDDLFISAETYELMGAIRRFFIPLLEAANEDSIPVLELPKEYIAGKAFYENGLIFQSEETHELREGITWTRLEYIDADSRPVVAYLLALEKGAGTLINGTPDNGYEIHNVRATTMEAILSAEEGGYDVIAGVNADFFAINSDYAPRGTCIKNGVVLKITTDMERGYFGILNDGSPIIGQGAPSSIALPNLVEAVGGTEILLRNGSIPSNMNDKTRHPRTAVGYDNETGTIYLLVVDGRQVRISNGAYYADLSYILLDAGATDALNLDGGGSSTFIVENPESKNGFELINSPSDGSMRKDYNSLLVVSEWI